MLKLLYIVPIVLLCFVASSVNAQEDLIKRQVDSLQYCGADFLDCSSVIWRIIAHEKKAIPYLLSKLNNTTPTKAHFNCKLKNLRVGDLAFMTLDRIIGLPIYAITHQQFDLIEDDCQVGVYDYIEDNRTKFSNQVKHWVRSDLKRYVWIAYEQNEVSECEKRNKITGRFYWR